MIYGIVVDGQLVIADQSHPDAKPVVYAPIPEFDQTTHYVVQQSPVDMGDHIYMGVEILELEITDEQSEYPMPPA